MLPLLISLASDPVPTDDNVKAGWTAFAVFVLLLVAIVLLGWSFSRQMKKVKKADEEGVYGASEAPSDTAHKNA
jgi:H+/gluconate symporter-like permease